MSIFFCMTGWCALDLGISCSFSQYRRLHLWLFTLLIMQNHGCLPFTWANRSAHGLSKSWEHFAQMKVYFPGLISAQYRWISIIIIIIIIMIIILAYFVLSLILPFQKDRNSSFVSKCKVPTNQLCTSKMRKTGFVYVAVIAPCQTIWCKLSKIVEKWNDAATFLYPHCISHP